MTNDPKNLKPRNGYLIVRLVRSGESKIIQPDTAKAVLEPDTNVLIVAVAPDCKWHDPMGGPVKPMFQVGDSVITNPSNFAQISEDFAFLHSSAVMAIERE